MVIAKNRSEKGAGPRPDVAAPERAAGYVAGLEGATVTQIGVCDEAQEPRLGGEVDGKLADNLIVSPEDANATHDETLALQRGELALRGHLPPGHVAGPRGGTDEEGWVALDLGPGVGLPVAVAGTPPVEGAELAEDIKAGGVAQARCAPGQARGLAMPEGRLARSRLHRSR